jgi:hypothetical protein
MQNLYAIIDTIKEEIVLTGQEAEIHKHMQFIIKTYGKNDLSRINRFEVITGEKNTILNYYK